MSAGEGRVSLAARANALNILWDAYVTLCESENATGRQWLEDHGLNPLEYAQHGLGLLDEADAELILGQAPDLPDAVGYLALPTFPDAEPYVTLYPVDAAGMIMTSRALRRERPAAPLWHGWHLGEGQDIVAILREPISAIIYNRMTAQPAVALGCATIAELAGALWSTDADRLPEKVLIVSRGECDEKFVDDMRRVLGAVGIRHLPVPFPTVGGEQPWQ